MRRHKGQSLIGTLVAIALMIGLGLVFVNGGFGLAGKTPERADGRGETMVGRSLLRAQDSKCQSNLGQVRQGIQIATDPVENTAPQTLEETRLGGQFYVCPIGKERYQYDPATGQVKCPHPGHEKY